MKILPVLIVLLLSSCINNNINSLNHETVKFNNLPNDLKAFLRNQSSNSGVGFHPRLFVLPIEHEAKYKLEDVPTWIGPWVYYTKLVNIEKNIHYEIDRDTPSPFIVFNDTLYYPYKYNILLDRDNLDSVKFRVTFLEN